MEIVKIPFEIFSVIAGVWAGFAFTFVSRSIIRLNKDWPHEQHQNFLNRIGLQNVLLAVALFAIGKLFGSGIVFGIDLAGVCSFENIVQGNIVIILVIGANFGLFMNIWIWFDKNISTGTTVGYIICLLIALLSMFFGYTFSRVFTTPFIFTVIMFRLLSSILLYQFQGFKYWNGVVKGFAIVGIFLLPLTAYGSSIMMACPT